MHRWIDHTLPPDSSGGWQFLPNSRVVRVAWGSLTATARAPRKLDIFAIGCWGLTTRDCQDSLLHWWFPGPDGRFGGPERLSDPVRLPDQTAMRQVRPAVTSWSQDRIDVFAYDLGGRLRHYWWPQNGWWSAESLPNPTSYPLDPDQPPAALAPNGRGHVSVFTTVSTGDGTQQWIMQGVFTNSRFDGWRTMGCPNLEKLARRTNPPTAASWGPGRADLFVRSNTGICHWWAQNTEINSGSSEVLPLPPSVNGSGDTISPVVVASPTGQSNRLDLFTTGAGGRTWHIAWDGSRWETLPPAFPGHGMISQMPVCM
jgi:hypothetical protein